MLKALPMVVFAALVVGFGATAAGRAAQLDVQQSMIVEAAGSACMGQDKSRNQARREALEAARKAAAEQALTYVKGETRVVEGKLQSDIVEAYTNASLKTIATLDEGWYQEHYSATAADECYRVRLKVEVLPDVKAMQAQGASNRDLANPTAPLVLQVWLNAEAYRSEEEIKLYLKGNKPFFARIIYTDAAGQITQLLPNPYRDGNYFAGGVVYEFPSGEDRFQLKVAAPFGAENIAVYAATGQLGKLQLSTRGSVYTVGESADDIAVKVRGVTPVQADHKTAAKDGAVEFTEARISLMTAP